MHTCSPSCMLQGGLRWQILGGTYSSHLGGRTPLNQLYPFSGSLGTTEPLVKQPACAPPPSFWVPSPFSHTQVLLGTWAPICGLLSRVRSTSAFLFPLSLTDISWFSSGIIFFWKLSGALPLPRYPTPTPSAPTKYHHTVMLLLVIMTNPRGQGLALLTAMGTRPDTGEDTGQACSETNGCLVFSGPAAAIAPYGCQVDSLTPLQSWGLPLHLLLVVSFSNRGLLPGLTAVA